MNDVPSIGSVWRSRDKRDDGLLVTVVAIHGRYVSIRRFRKTRVRLDRFRRDYAEVVDE